MFFCVRPSWYAEYFKSLFTARKFTFTTRLLRPSLPNLWLVSKVVKGRIWFASNVVRLWPVTKLSKNYFQMCVKGTLDDLCFASKLCQRCLMCSNTFDSPVKENSATLLHLWSSQIFLACSAYFITEHKVYNFTFLSLNMNLIWDQNASKTALSLPHIYAY